MIDRYEITIEPATRLAMFRDKPCLRVTVVDRSNGWDYVGSKYTKRRSQDQARSLAAKLIADWETDHSEVTIP